MTTHFAYALAFAIVWTFSISFGRLYLGVHSPTDLKGGFLLGVWITVSWSLVLGFVDHLIVQNKYLLWAAVVLGFVVILGT